MRGIALAIVGMVVVTGCATVTFKRGAGPVTSDEDACRAASQTPEAYADCLRERGFFVAGKGAAPASTAKAAKAPSPAAAPSPSAPKPAAPAAGAARSTPSPVADVPAKAEAAPAELDPLTPLEVSSWWKLGGSAADLDRAIAACVDKLGAAHKPEPGARVVTAGMRACLRAAKWFPLGGEGGRY